MATSKTKKDVKVRDLKPSKDAKGGVARQKNTNRGGGHQQDGGRGRNLDGGGGRNLL